MRPPPKPAIAPLVAGKPNAVSPGLVPQAEAPEGHAPAACGESWAR